MNRFIPIFSTVLLCTTALQAQEMLDSVEMEQVVVTGTRTPKLLSSAPVLTKVITASDLQKTDATNLRDLLQQVIPGVEFSYAMNQQVHFNFSGFGGQSMLVLIDGERLAGETMDDVDFTRIGMENVERIEIIKGAASALYGSNANGGVINIITKERAKKFGLNLNSRIARHKEWRNGAVLQFASGKFTNLLTLNRNTIDNYNVKNANQPITRVISTIYGDDVTSVKEQFTFTPISKLILTGRAGYFIRQVERTPGTKERYRDFSGGVRAQWQIAENDYLEGAYAFDQYDKSDYQAITRLDIRGYSNVQNSFRVLYNKMLVGDDLLSIGADFLHDYLFNNRLNGSTKIQDSFDAFVQYDMNLGQQWELVGALRYDYFSDGRTSRITPKLSTRYSPRRNLNIRLGYGMGFRSPTLKEKYYNFDMSGIWIVEGNPSLKPEVSHNFNISAEYTRNPYNLTVCAYYNRVDDKIAAGAPYFATPSDRLPRLPYINLAGYSALGAEATAQARWKCGLSARISYAFTHEQLPKNKQGAQVNNQYIPARKHSVVVHTDWDKNLNKNLGLCIALDGRILSAVDNKEYVDYYDVSKGLVSVHYPPYTLWKFSVAARIRKFAKLTAAVDNVLNYKPSYYYLNCPLTDGANFMLGISLDVDQLFK